MTLFEKFKKLTNINIENFYVNLVDFYDNYEKDILNYYTDYNFKYPTEAFLKYSRIVQELEVIVQKIVLYKGNFETTYIWDLIDELDTIKLQLDNISVYPKLYKVGFYKKQTNDDDNYQTYVMKAHETIESVARDYNQNITDLVLINELNEEQWTDAGGKKIILKTNLINSQPEVQQVETIFDVLTGKNLLGKDLPSYFSIDTEEGDLEVLSPEQTFLKAVQILFELKMGEIPEYPNLGVDKNIFGECTKGNVGFTFPIMFRQLNIALETDDTILNFEINDIEFDEKTMSYTIYASVQNRLYDSLKFVTNIE